LAAEALAAYLSAQEWQVAAIREALDAADAGAKPSEHEMVMGWLRSWGTEDEQSRPR
jgi:predicted transcriptional regulator